MSHLVCPMLCHNPLMSCFKSQSMWCILFYVLTQLMCLIFGKNQPCMSSIFCHNPPDVSAHTALSAWCVLLYAACSVIFSDLLLYKCYSCGAFLSWMIFNQHSKHCYSHFIACCFLLLEVLYHYLTIL